MVALLLYFVSYVHGYMKSIPEKGIGCAITEKRQIARVIMEKRQLACVIMEKRQIGCAITVNRQIACFITVVDSIAPFSRVKANTQKWFDGEVLENINTRDKLFKKFKKSRLHIVILIKSCTKKPNTID